MKGFQKKILVLGSGPIVIGQACEFDYSGTQACRALKDEGATVILVNSNPATIMTDPSTADRTYVEPLVPEVLDRILSVEKPDAVLPTVGGQTALNLALDLAESGILAKHGVELIGASLDAIHLAEDRERFSHAMAEIGIQTPRSMIVTNMEEAQEALKTVGAPAIVRPSFTLGGTGGGMAYTDESFLETVKKGLDASPSSQVLVEQSIEGWKEYELEVMRDRADNVVIVCSIENLDPMGVHTGDSITVAPAQTLTDREYQAMRNAALQIIRRVGVETGGSNIQFAVNPANGELHVIEMNPRVSRSSALASKATGFPIAKIAAKLALGYTLDQIANDITQTTPSAFEPVIDYVVVKVPRFDFAKFPGAGSRLGPQMKSVGEVMSIGRHFREAFRKAIASMEVSHPSIESADANLKRLQQPTPDRIFGVFGAIRDGVNLKTVQEMTGIDPWFLHQFSLMASLETEVKNAPELTTDILLKAKREGVSDAVLSGWLDMSEDALRAERWAKHVNPSYLRVDTCAGEFESFTPYMYSSYEGHCEAEPTDSESKVLILGSGPNRIGQGIEFDYCCCHASYALRGEGWETILLNCNPETVSTDYDTSDRLYFEPLSLEYVLEVARKEKPRGAIVQLGGQTPLKLAAALVEAGIPILGTQPDAIDLSEDRGRFGALMEQLGIRQPKHRTATSTEEALTAAREVGFPILVRPSYVLGGQAMRLCYNEDDLTRYLESATRASEDRPVLIDQYLEDAFEYDVDAICDGETVVIAGIMQHVEEAGIHSGDSTALFPPYALGPDMEKEIRETTRSLGIALNVKGLMNVQFAEKEGVLYIIEVNPRASRTIPFLAKATGVPLVQKAVHVMAGQTLAEVGLTEDLHPELHFAKAPVFPFSKFPGVDILLGPEMRSTGEVMGIGATPGEAFWKSTVGAKLLLPSEGRIFLSVNDHDKDKIVDVARRLHDMGFELVGTQGTVLHLFQNGVPAQLVFKVGEGTPDVEQLLTQGEVQLVINTPLGRQSHFDEKAIRLAATRRAIPCITTLSAAEAAVQAMEHARTGEIGVYALQDLGTRSKLTS